MLFRLFLLSVTLVITMSFTQSINGQELKHMNIHYGTDVKQTLDIYAPSGKESINHPVIIYVHGGGWMRGDKSNVSDKPSFYTNRGYVFISVNYRLHPNATYNDMANDISTAVKWVYDRTDQYHIDKKRINLMGHSAGGHLVMLIGTDQSYLQHAGIPANSVQSIVNLDGPIDLVKFLPKNEQYKEVFGHDRQAWMAASPAANAANQHLPPMLLVTQNRNSVFNFIEETKKTGNTADIFVTHSLTHREITKLLGSNNNSAEAMSLTKAVEDFLKTYNSM
ncbi:alpha/beta hydrolase [Neobacillus sp. 114]|uniref:alpha/beta hydrolase n=1 Tax=Neobacillus sp. 114 TaxID=3048535 RepID=UPI001C21F15A|nr:alpha/beta hydrolase [Neobacillus sp. 114]MBU8920057.1 alpha/beta hydrolase [Bacillus sp. FJAT-29953]